MKLFNITESIESQRSYFRQKLIDNKEQLQQARTRLGVTRTLKKIFPNVNFKLFSTGRYAAGYTPEKGVIISNNNRLMSGKTVRNNWSWFLKQMTDLLTHEFIHKEQANRRGIDEQPVEKTTLNKQEINYLRHKMMNLRADYYEYLNRGEYEEADRIQKQITKLKKAAEKQNFNMYGTRQNYLSDRDEITAYAENIADELIAPFEGRDKEEVRQLALNKLRHIKNNDDPTINRYINTFRGIQNKPVKQLLKQVARYIEAKTQ